jgi:hypothetical protein
MPKLRLTLTDKHGTVIDSSDLFSVEEFFRAVNSPAASQHLLQDTCTGSRMRAWLNERDQDRV